MTLSPHSQWSLSFGQYKTPFGTDYLTATSAMPFVNAAMTGLAQGILGWLIPQERFGVILGVRGDGRVRVTAHVAWTRVMRVGTVGESLVEFTKLLFPLLR